MQAAYRCQRLTKGEKMSFFSVIIPAYNCEKYLTAAVESVRNQPVKDVEIIIVDDGSEDSTGTVCDRLAEENNESACGPQPRVRVIHQKNRGAAAARNAGILRAEGEYILFLDADDIYAEKAIDSQLLEECRKGYDMIMCSSLMANVERDRYRIDIRMRNGIFEGGQAYPISGTFAACLYKKSMLTEHHVLFDEGISMNEDQTFKMKAMYASGRIRAYDRVLYIYNVTPGSARYTGGRNYDFVEAWNRAYRWLELYGAGGNISQAKAFVRQKILSRQLLYAKLYVCQGHGAKALLAELERIGAWESLKALPMNEMIPSQRADLGLLQDNLQKFVRYARKEGWKIRAGRMLLKIKFVRKIRDRKRFPMKAAVL